MKNLKVSEKDIQVITQWENRLTESVIDDKPSLTYWVGGQLPSRLSLRSTIILFHTTDLSFLLVKEKTARVPMTMAMMITQ